MIHSFFARRAAAAALAVGLSTAAPASAINLFSERQEVELGRRSAAEAERQLPMLRDGEVESYVNGIVRRLASAAPGPRFPYQARVVNASDINAFALPGGYLYVNRGLIEAVRNEDELAGVLAHEMAHVAERHGTEQLTKAYGVQAGAGILAQILAGRDGRLGVGEQVIGSLGLNALMMKFSRDAENEADRVGAQTMARAGYDPLAMASFFDLLQQQRGRNPSAVSQFFSSHPSPANRSANIRRLAQEVGRGRTARRTTNLNAVQARLDRYPDAPRARALG
jgi:beta-barrel assembly-enhancing protease